MHILPNAAAMAAALIFATIPAPTSAAPRPEAPLASVKTDGGPVRTGRLEARGDRLTLTEPDGTVHPIDPSTLTALEFEQKPTPAKAAAPPLADGPLPNPWKAGAVGDLPGAGSAAVKDGMVVIETSSPDRGAPFGSFFAVHRPLPQGGSHITARVSRISNSQNDVRSGIMIRDGIGPGATTVFLALSHQSPATLASWNDPTQWNGFLSGDTPAFCSDFITAGTPGQSTQIDVDITGAKKLFLVAQGGPDGIVSDWADWTEPRLRVNGKEMKLTNLKWLSATSDFGTVNNGKSALGGALKIDGKPVAYGIGTHANSLIEFDLPPGTTRFKSRVGIDQGGGVKLASIRFMVFTERPKTTVSQIEPVAPGLFVRTDSQIDSRLGHWLRLVRQGGRITGFVSPDGEFWREIGSVEDKMKPKVFAALAAQGRKKRTRWETDFDHVAFGPAGELGEARTLDPEIVLIDGTIFHGQIDSASPTQLRLGSVHDGRIIPTIHVSRVKFHHSSEPGFDEALNGRREGIALANGDFFEGKFTGIEGGKLTAQSPLFGTRRFDLGTEVTAWVLRPAPKFLSPPSGYPYVLETWRGERLFGKAIRIEKGELTIDTARLRTQRFPLPAISRLERADSAPE